MPSLPGHARRAWSARILSMLLPLAGGSGTVVTFGEFIMILELHRQGLKVAAIARQLGIDRKTVRKYISRSLEPPTYGPRPHRQKSTDPFLPYLRGRSGPIPLLCKRNS